MSQTTQNISSFHVIQYRLIEEEILQPFNCPLRISEYSSYFAWYKLPYSRFKLYFCINSSIDVFGLLVNCLKIENKIDIIKTITIIDKKSVKFYNVVARGSLCSILPFGCLKTKNTYRCKPVPFGGPERWNQLKMSVCVLNCVNFQSLDLLRCIQSLHRPSLHQLLVYSLQANGEFLDKVDLFVTARPDQPLLVNRMRLFQQPILRLVYLWSGLALVHCRC